jgi:hypothetical protein
MKDGTYDCGAHDPVPITCEFIILALENREPFNSYVELQINKEDNDSSIDELHHKHLRHARKDFISFGMG